MLGKNKIISTHFKKKKNKKKQTDARLSTSGTEVVNLLWGEIVNANLK